MVLEVVTLPAQIIIGLEAVVPVTDLAGMSEAKTELIAKLKAEQAVLTSTAVDDEFYGVNFATDEQNYLVGVKVAMTDPLETNYLVAAGLYAVFTTTIKQRAAADQFIADAYGILAQSAEYVVAANHNLEVITPLITGKGAFRLYIPVAAK